MKIGRGKGGGKEEGKEEGKKGESAWLCIIKTINMNPNVDASWLDDVDVDAFPGMFHEYQ